MQWHYMIHTQLIGGLQDLAEGVASEYSTLQRSALVVEEATKRTESTSKNRFQELKRLRDQNAELKSIIEEDREMMQANIVALSEENANLREQLHVKSEQLAPSEHDLNKACEEIHVSDIAMCTCLNSYSLYFFHPSKKLTPHVIKKTGKGNTWDPVVAQLILEHLSHRTPPSSFMYRAKHSFYCRTYYAQRYTIMIECPGLRFVRYCRSILVYVTKTTAAFEVALASEIVQMFFDGTSRRQTEMNNLIPKVRDVFRPGQYRKVTLDGCIIARDGTAEETAISFRACFKQGSHCIRKIP